MEAESSVKPFRENETLGLESPELNFGTFTMSLPSNPRGFEVDTDESFPRRAAHPNDGLNDVLNGEQRERLSRAMQAQLGFTTGDKAKEALDRYRTDPSEENKKAYEKAHQGYKDRFSIVVGVRNIRRSKEDPDKIIVDTIPVSFPMFAQFGNENSSDKLLTLSGTTSTSMILITQGDKPRIIVQRRSKKNSAYIDVPGASASGYVDSIPFQKNPDGKASNNRRKFRPLTMDDLRKNALRELKEELGIEEKDVSEIANSGIAHSNENANNDFTFFARTRLSADEVRKNATKTNKNSKFHEQEFMEKFVDIEASPEAVFMLVTKMKCPIPPTHTAAFIAAGYRMMIDLEAKGLREKGSAEKYKKEVVEGVRKNYKDIDERVRSFYAKNPNVLEEIPNRILERIDTAVSAFIKRNPEASKSKIDVERKSQIKLIMPRNRDGFSPDYSPEEQGLPDFETALRDAGLVDTDNTAT